MRQIVTGIDEAGSSCIVEESTVGSAGKAFYESPSTLAPRPPGKGQFVDVAVPVGTNRWMVMDLAPGFKFEMHHTDTIDLDTVLAGSIDLILDDGRHSCTVGDCVVVTGVDHAWEVGPDGCTLSVVFLGTPPPA